MSTFDERSPHLASSAVRTTDGSVREQALPLSSTDDVIRPHSEAETGRMSQGKALAWEVAQTILLTIAIFLSVRLVVQNFRVEGASMDPTLRSGQFLLINKLTYTRVDGTPLEPVIPARNSRSSLHYLFGGPARGDIIVFRAPSAQDKDFIKRVIGLPGESVQIKEGRVFINGSEIDEPYIEHHAKYDFDAKIVPSGSFFVLGDNRPNSSDSHVFGFITADSIIGRAWVSYWPPNLWGVVESAAYAIGN